MIFPELIKELATRVESAGGVAELVGGGAISWLTGETPSDWDIEVSGVGFERLEQIFSDKKPKLVGREFGILKLSALECDGLDIDINVPRLDNHHGAGHKDLSVTLAPNLPLVERARRRDFTMNAMGVNILTGLLSDPFGGRADLSNGILRATDETLFVQDPLRALRAGQLLSRKLGPNGKVDPRTMDLIRSMHGSFDQLAPERVFCEIEKGVMKSPKPSLMFEMLRDSGWISHFPVLANLIGCEQHPEWHPEGDVWIHSMHTLDSAAWVRDNGNLPADWVRPFMFATLCHDVGKPSTTVTPKMVAVDEFPMERLWSAWGHDRAGVPLVESFLRQMTNEKVLIERASSIVGEHMQPWNLFQGAAKKPAWKRLHNRIRLDVLGWMCKCDSCGGPDVSIGDPDFEHETSSLCWDKFSEFGESAIKPILKGRDLIAAGVTPGFHFSHMLECAFQAQIDDENLSHSDLLGVAISSRI